MHDDLSEEKQGQIATNLRLLLLLEEVARAGVPVTPAALKDHLRLPKPTLHRLFHTAEEEGFLQRDIDGRSYGPGPRLRRLAVNTISSQRIRTLRVAVLSRVAEAFGETCNISTPDRDAMIYLDRVETHWPLRIQLPVGSRVPFHCTSAGKMYLSSLRPSYLNRLLENLPLDRYVPGTITDRDRLKAELEITRKRGFSTDNEEFMEGMVAVAVPIRDAQNRVVSTLSVNGPLQRISLDGLVSKVDTLFAAAEELSDIINS
jgi:DNA-binding IclR family transcriptional regulator